MVVFTPRGFVARGFARDVDLGEGAGFAKGLDVAVHGRQPEPGGVLARGTKNFLGVEGTWRGRECDEDRVALLGPAGLGFVS
jgi:hypothetical protein